MTNNPAHEHTGGPVSYYKVEVKIPTSLPSPYTAECNDIIEALNMTFAEGEVLKAVWRKAAARVLGKQKIGDTPVYNAEKQEFYGHRQVVMERALFKQRVTDLSARSDTTSFITDASVAARTR